MTNLTRTKLINNWEIETPEGFSDFLGIAETKEMEVWGIKLSDDSTHFSSFTHAYYLHDDSEILVRDLYPGAKLKLKDQILDVIDIWYTGRNEKLYDPLDIQNENKNYYSDNLISHNSFLGSSLTLINSTVLENLTFKKKVNQSELYDLLHHFKEHLYIYKKPRPNRQYVMSCDSSKQRVGSVGDPMVIQIIDITKFPFRQVACFHATDNFHYLQTPEVIYEMGRYYNWAFTFIENNEIGQAIVDSLAIDFEYENVYYEKPNLAGYRTTKKTKRLGCSTLRSFIEKGKLILYDMETISQLSTFVSNGKGSYSAEDGYHDDAVMSLIGTLFFVHCPEFESFDSRKSMAEKIFNKEIIEVQLEEALPSFGIIDVDGVDEFNESIFF